MFLNDLSISSIPFIGIIFLIITLSSSKTIRLFKYQLSTKQKNSQSINNQTNDTQNSQISIQVNPLSQLDPVNSYQERSTTVPLDDDDEELIKSDISSISASNFCENSSIELRLDQDLEYDNDLTNENSN